MRRLLVAALLITACASSGAVPPTTTTGTPPSSTTSIATTTTTAATTTTVETDDCPAAPYEFGYLPFGVGVGEVDMDSLEPDEWTSVPGTHTTFIPRDDGSVALALIRGTLPAVDWPGEKGEVSIDGTPAVVGPHPDGTWVAGWFEQPETDRCNLYSLVFYPPWDPSDVQATIEGMNRVGG